MPDFRSELHPRDRKGRWRDIAKVRALRPGEGHRLSNGMHVSRGSGGASGAYFVSPYGHSRGVSGGKERFASPEEAVLRAHQARSPGRPVGAKASYDAAVARARAEAERAQGQRPPTISEDGTYARRPDGSFGQVSLGRESYLGAPEWRVSFWDKDRAGMADAYTTAPDGEAAKRALRSWYEDGLPRTARSPGRPLDPNETEVYRDYGTPDSRAVMDRVLRAHPEAQLSGGATVVTIHTPIGDLEVEQETGGTHPAGLAHALDPSFPTAAEQLAHSPGRPVRDQAARYIADLESGGRGLDTAGWLARIGWLRDNGYYTVPPGPHPTRPWTDYLSPEGRQMALAAMPGIARSPGRPMGHNASLGTEYREAEHAYREAQHSGRDAVAERTRLESVRSALNASLRRNAMGALTAHSPGRPSVPEPEGGISLRQHGSILGPFSSWDQAAQGLTMLYDRDPTAEVEAYGHSFKSRQHSRLNASEQRELVRRASALIVARSGAAA